MLGKGCCEQMLRKTILGLLKRNLGLDFTLPLVPLSGSTATIVPITVPLGSSVKAVRLYCLCSNLGGSSFSSLIVIVRSGEGGVVRV